MSRAVIGLLCLLFVLPVAGAAKGIYGNSYALVVGIDNYKHSMAWGKLGYPKKDAGAMANYLRARGFKVIELYDQDATREAIVSALEDRIAPQLKQDDRVLLFYSGHGHTRTLGGKERGYIVPYDGKGSGVASLLSMKTLREQADILGKAKHLLFVLDACYGGQLAYKAGVGLAKNHPHYIEEVTRREARQFLTAGGKDEQVLDGGPKGLSWFTGYLLEALEEGKGDLDGDRYITTTELAAYLEPRASNDYQTPGHGQFPGHAMGEFVFRVPSVAVESVPKTTVGDVGDVQWGIKAGLRMTPIEEQYRARKNARIRRQPTVSSPQIGSLKRGDPVWVAGKVNDQPWYLVDRDDGQGYVFSSLLSPSSGTLGGSTKVSASTARLAGAKAGTEGRKKGDTWTEPQTGMEFLWVPKGCFQMGCGSWAGQCADDEKPVHEVCVDGYWMGRTEVTQGQWEKVMEDNLSIFKKGGNHPVEMVSWEDAQGFIGKLNVDGVTGLRLPTEAEWEYACRSGGREEVYAGGDGLKAVGWFGEDIDDGHHPVAKKEANGLGLFDMSGNVWEWTQDWYDEAFYKKSGKKNPLSKKRAKYRVLRGGAFLGGARWSRCADRLGYSPGGRLRLIGLRLARSPQD